MIVVSVAIGVAVLTHLLSTSPKAAPNYINLEELECMAKNIYFEARNEATVGQLAVGQTVINRVQSSRFPNTICGVVHQGVHTKDGFPLKTGAIFRGIVMDSMMNPEKTRVLGIDLLNLHK